MYRFLPIAGVVSLALLSGCAGSFTAGSAAAPIENGISSLSVVPLATAAAIVQQSQMILNMLASGQTIAPIIAPVPATTPVTPAAPTPTMPAGTLPTGPTPNG